ncbi:MAG: hypothetical protein ACRDFB_07485 [Rhabdochlamydiaceae bacterium]
MVLGSIAVAVGIGKWSKPVQSFFDNIYPHLYDSILVALIVGSAVIGIYYYKTKDSSKKLLDHEMEGKIKHTQNDILPAYRRLVGLQTEEKNGKLVFMVDPIHRRSKRDKTLDEAFQEVWEMQNTPKTPLEVLTDGVSSLEHLKNKEYKEIYKHFKKAKESVENFNQTKNESLKPKIDESIVNFKRELIHLIDRLDNNHLLKGKCSSCP